MIYLYYTVDSTGNVEVQHCPDEFNYLDTLYTLEAEGKVVPYDIRWHSEAGMPEMRILAISTTHADLSGDVQTIIEQCKFWLHRN